MDFDFERLEVYSKALDFADTVYNITEEFPERENYGLTSQLRRAAVSISLNLAEGVGRDTKADRRRFYIMARGSLFECIPLIEISSRRKMFSQETRSGLRSRCVELGKMISGLIRSLKDLQR